jgi:hypothetical protein
METLLLFRLFRIDVINHLRLDFFVLEQQGFRHHVLHLIVVITRHHTLSPN